MLRLVAAAAVLPQAWWIALVFLGAAALFGRGALRGCSRNLLVGSDLALLAPVLVALAGIEPFEPAAHHLVRLAVLAGMLGAWHLTRRSAWVPSPAPSV